MPPKPITTEDLETAYKQVNEQEWYKTNLEIIENFLKLYLKLYPENKDPKIVAVKVALIDSTNSTHFSTQQRNGVTLMQFAQNIIDCDFDERIKQRCPRLVRDISKGHERQWTRNFFSLASKYCHYHNRLLESIPEENRYKYPIYDSNVSKNIPKYIDGWTTGKLQTLAKNGNYKKFNEIIEEILKNNGITEEMMPCRKVALDCLLYLGDNNDENNN